MWKRLKEGQRRRKEGGVFGLQLCADIRVRRRFKPFDL